LYTRTRHSYDCTLTPPASEIRVAAPANLLAFTCPFYQTAGHSINVSAQKNEFTIITSNLKNAAAVVAESML